MDEFFYGMVTAYTSVVLILVAQKVSKNEFDKINSWETSDYDI